MSNVESNNHLLALAVANERNSELFNLFLKDFTAVVHGHTFFTNELKSSAVRVHTLIEGWLETANGILHKRIIDFQQDFESCLSVLKNLPTKINRHWQRKLRPWYNYARNLIVETATLPLCLFKAGYADLKQAFMKAGKTKFTALSQNPALREVLGINSEIEAEVIIVEERFSRRNSALSDHLTYDEVKKLQGSTPPENSVDPTKSIRLAAEAQLKRSSQWGMK